jgi:pyruvate dehydrogenase E1 component alpha subunit
LLDSDELNAVDDEVATLVDQAVAAARAAEPPSATALLTDVYVSY